MDHFLADDLLRFLCRADDAGQDVFLTSLDEKGEPVEIELDYEAINALKKLFASHL